MKPLSFGKAERLKSRKVIDALFTDRRSLVQVPLRVKYRFETLTENAVPAQAGVSVSKKAFKSAVARNRIKRQLREAYRLQKGTLVQTLEHRNLHASLFFMYTDKTAVPYAVIYTAMAACLQQLVQKALTHERTY